MRPVVVDAGVILEIAIGGGRSAAAEALLRGRRPEAPGHALVEAVGVLRRLAASGAMTVADAGTAVERVLAFPVRLHGADAVLIAEAWQHRDNVTIADALYAVLARRLGAPLVTLDKALARAPGLGCEVLLPS